MGEALCITLGHNSSAILMRDGTVVCGYEEERLSGIKSDSSFPRKSIEKVLSFSEVPKNELNVCISHWELDGDYKNAKQKHFDYDYLCSVSEESNWYTVNTDFTHHDAHYYSALLFSGKEHSDVFGVVIDGFGTSGEVMSFYNNGNCVSRKFGFKSSFGLLYQYTTSFLGMKENQDEYKLLGYEAKYVESENHDIVLSKIQNLVDNYCKTSHKIESRLSDLNYTREYVYDIMNDFCDSLKLTDNNVFEKRVYVSYFLQRTLEESVIKIISEKVNSNNAHNKMLLLCGGVFMNVKLNKIIVDNFPLVCIMPLCGDQGAALGVYHKYFNDGKWPEHLYWGIRDLEQDIEGCIDVKANELAEVVIETLQTDGIVQVICGNMEFGARSLCNTSTLALPTHKNTEYINEVNGRSTIMPMAPVVPQKFADKMKNSDKVYKSLEYMICALDATDLINEAQSDFTGIANYYLRDKTYSCRPQIARHGYIVDVVNEIGPIINTSLNAHGQPIVYDKESIEKCLKMQNYKIKTYKVS